MGGSSESGEGSPPASASPLSAPSLSSARSRPLPSELIFGGILARLIGRCQAQSGHASGMSCTSAAGLFKKSTVSQNPNCMQCTAATSSIIHELGVRQRAR